MPDEGQIDREIRALARRLKPGSTRRTRPSVSARNASLLSPPMDPTDEARARIEQVSLALEHHNRRYYELDDPEITDADYDALVRELQALETATPASPERIRHCVG